MNPLQVIFEMTSICNTLGMDPVSRRNFWKIIRDLKDDEKTVILTTQFLDEAEELADRIGIMAKGLKESKTFALMFDRKNVCFREYRVYQEEIWVWI